MDESQRSANYNAWRNSKIWLEVTKDITQEKATVSVTYKGIEYKESFLKSDCYGSSKPYNIAFNMLLSRMREINKDIEFR